MKNYFINGIGQNEHIEGCETLSIDYNNPILDVDKADILIAFSMGVLPAVNETNRLKLKKLILCSPTPILFDPNKLEVEEIILIGGKREGLDEYFSILESKDEKKRIKIHILETEDHILSNSYKNFIVNLIKNNNS